MGVRVFAVLLASAGLLAGGCGASETRRTTFAESDAANLFESGRIARASAALSQWTEQHPEDTAARHEHAQIQIAQGDAPGALRALAPPRTVEDQRLRVRAMWMSRDFEGARQAAIDPSLDSLAEEDGWLFHARGFLEEASQPLLDVSGTERGTLPFVSALPIVEVLVEGQRRLALVATGADLTVVDRDVMAVPGVIDRLDLSGPVVRNVPALSQDLSFLHEQTGQEIEIVLGWDVLRLFRLSLDFARGELSLAPPGTGGELRGATVPLVTLNGSALAVAGQTGSVRGWFIFDTGAFFYLAFAQEPSGPIIETGDAQLSQARFGDVAFEYPRASAPILPTDLTAVTGVPTRGVFGVLLMDGRRVTIDPELRRIGFE